MLKSAIVCILLVATAAMAWVPMEDIPTTTQTGTRIAGGKSGYDYYVWGVFPYGSYTRFGYSKVNTGNPFWQLDAGNVVPYLEHTSAAYQWQSNVVFFFSGHAYNANKLYLCGWSLNPSSVNLPVAPGDGSCITYVPYGNNPGWVYYLSQSDGGQFWKYSLVSSDDIVVDGICPGESAIIGNSTPLFQWGSVAASQYRLLVSSDSLFSDTVIDVAGSNPEYQTTTALTNGPYYWRWASWIGGAWSWSDTHNFRVDFGWTQLSGLTDNTGGVGASMAYKGSFGESGHASILLLVGGGSTHFWQYNLSSNEWDQLANSPSSHPQYVGTSLTTEDPTGQDGRYAWASFGGQQALEDFPWFYSPYSNAWYEWNYRNDDAYYDALYLENITSNASMVYGEPHVMYLVTGDREFFRVDPPPDNILMIAEGAMSSGTCVERTRAHTITRNSGFGVEYQLSKTAHVRAMLHDAVGRQVGTLDVGEQGPGSHKLNWSTDGEGRKLGAGAYFVLLDTGTEQTRLKAVVR